MSPHISIARPRNGSREDASPASTASPGPKSSTPASFSVKPDRPSVTSPPKADFVVPLSCKPKISPSIKSSHNAGQHQSPLASPMIGGPLNSTYVVPPRPKPGRKPATDDPPSKRKAQNRDAQRAFRDRKKQRLDELEVEAVQMRQRLEELEQERLANLHQIDTLRSDLQRSKDHVKSLEQKIEELNKIKTEPRKEHEGYLSLQHAHLPPVASSLPWSTQSTTGSITATAFSKASTVGCGNCRDNGECPCVDEMVNFNAPKTTVSEQPGLISPMSPADASDAQQPYEEIDFTNVFKKPEVRASLNKEPSFSNILQQDGCGLCTSESDCLCRLTSKDEEAKRGRPSLPPPVRTQLSNGDPAASSTATLPCFTSPGSCAECRTNPEQRRFCQTLSALPPLSEDSLRSRRPSSQNQGSRNSSIERPPAKKRQTTKFGSVSEAYHAFKERNMDVDAIIDHPERSFVRKEASYEVAGRRHTELELHALDVLCDLGRKASLTKSMSRETVDEE